MTSCRKELRYTCGIESSLGQAERGSQSGPSSTHHERIIFMILFKTMKTLFMERGFVRAYDDRILGVDERRCLLGSQRLISDDTSWERWLKTQNILEGIIRMLPAGFVVENNRIGWRDLDICHLS